MVQFAWERVVSLTARQHKREIGAALLFVLLVVLPLAVVLLQRPQLQTPQEPNEENDAYWWPQSRTVRSLFLRFSAPQKARKEPTFVYVYVDHENRFGGFWGLVGGLRTIDWQNFSEAQLNATHWRTQSRTPWGLRQVDFHVCSEHGSLVLLVNTSYQLNQTMDVLDWYWEQINYYGVDQNARVVVGLQNNTTCRMAWNVTSIPDVTWLWMKYREWVGGQERTVSFMLCQPCTIFLQREHGNDVAPQIRVQNGSFQTIVRFDAQCPETTNG
jgi:hypothetical protein